MATRRVGATAVRVSSLGLGGAPLGNHQHEVTEGAAESAIDKAYRLGIRYFDVAPQYGHGLAEHRMGRVLREVSPPDFILSTKVGRLLSPRHSGRGDAPGFRNTLAFDFHYDYSYDGIMRSVEDSLQRLGLPNVDILFIHNIDSENLAGENERFFKQAIGSGHKALMKLRDEGIVGAIGVGNNHWQICKRFAMEAHFDCFMVASASAYSLLLTHLLDDFLPFCSDRNISVIVGGAFNSGILATGAVEDAQFAYGTASPEVLKTVRSMDRICRAHSVPLAAAALQFPLGHPVVASVVQGVRSAEQVRSNFDAFHIPIPEAFWDDLKGEGLLRSDAPVPRDAQMA